MKPNMDNGENCRAAGALDGADGNRQNNIPKKTTKASVVDYVFTSYDSLSERWKQSGVHTALSVASTSKIYSSIRRRVARSAENSLILRAIAAFVGKLPAVTVRAYGTFVFSLGFYSMLVYVIKAIASTMTADIDALVTSVMLILISLPLLFSKKTLAEAVLESKAASFIAFDILGYRREVAALQREPRGRCDTPMLIGMVLGLLTFYVDIIYVMALVGAVIGIYLLSSRPEAGVVMLFVLLPFLPEGALAVYVTVLSFSYLFKLITGRRTLHFDPADTAMLIFAAAVYLAGVIHYGAGTDIGAHSTAPLIFVYFVIANLITNDKWRKRCLHAVMIGGGLTASVYLLSQIFDIASILGDGFSSGVLSRLSEDILFIVGESDDVTPYLIMVLPMMLSYIDLPGHQKAGMLYGVFAIVTVVSLIYTGSRSLWMGAVLTVMILLLAKNLKYVWIPAAVVTAVPLLVWILPTEFDRYILGLFDLSGATARVGVRGISALILRDNFLGGIGFSDDVFSAVYSSYSQFGITAENSQSFPLSVAVRLGVTGVILFLAAVVLLFIKAATNAKKAETSDERSVSVSTAAGFFAIIVSGISLDIFYSEKMFLFFFMYAAFMSSYSAVKPKPSSTLESLLALRDGKTASIDIERD